MRKRAPTFEQTTPAPLYAPSECRHIAQKRADPYRQCWVWSAVNGPDVIGATRIHVVLCIRCWRVLCDVAEVGGDA